MHLFYGPWKESGGNPPHRWTTRHLSQVSHLSLEPATVLLLLFFSVAIATVLLAVEHIKSSCPCEGTTAGVGKRLEKLRLIVIGAVSDGIKESDASAPQRHHATTRGGRLRSNISRTEVSLFFWDGGG